MDGQVLALSTAALPMLGVAVVILLLGSAGVARERASAVTISFLVLAALASWWLATVSVMMMSATHDAALMWARIVYVGVSLLPAAILQFALALTDELRARRAVLIATWMTSTAFAILFTTTDLFIVDVYRYSWGHYAKLSVASVAFLFFLACVLVTSVVTLRRAMVSTLTEQQKRRASSFLGALAVGYIGAVDFLPSFGIDIAPVGYLAVFGFVVLSIRTIHRYRFVDLSPSFVADQLLDTVHGGVIVVDLRGAIHLANPAAASLLAQPADSLVGTSLPSLLHMTSLPMAKSATFARIGRMRNRPMAWPRSDGGNVEVSVSATLLRDHEQLPIGILYVLDDLTERRQAERNEFAANHDPLTGIPNRAYLSNRFDQRVAEIATHGRTTALLFLDLDGFKRVNDEHGHSVGDRLLQVVASRLRNAVRDDDILVRYGGDEFVVLLNIREASDAQIVADKLRRVMHDPFVVDALTLRVGASIGIAIAPEDGAPMDDLVRDADKAMYRNKRGNSVASTPTRDRVAPSPFGAESRA